ncbi:MAG: hypothetical protein ACMXYG_04910 [Candidatus Woesearchaeota archaeon]
MENVIIPNPSLLNSKIETIRNDGTENLHIVSDFDQTLTKAFVQGKKTNSSFAQIRGKGYLDPEYAEISYKLYDYYHPIEISSKISKEEKNIKMQEWWIKHLELMIKYGMNLDILKDIAVNCDIYPRESMLKMLDYLSKKEIPILIFSAGLGDVITQFLNSNSKLSSNLHIISNFYQFNDDGKVVGYKSSVIHPYNKNEYAIKNTSYYNEVKHRKNVILLGDSLGDVNMAEGLSHSVIIKIGFLNENVDEMLDIFKNEFDIILLNDQSMDYILNLLYNLFNKN